MDVSARRHILPVKFLAICSVFGLVLPLLSASAIAQTEQVECDVGVRVIKGTKNASKFRRQSLNTGRYLADMKPQLEPLPYGHYDVLDEVNGRTTLAEKISFRVKDAMGLVHTLHVTPEAVKDKRVHLMVDWKDPEDKEVLSTMIRVGNGKSVVLGTDSSADSSTIMSIRANCN